MADAASRRLERERVLSEVGRLLDSGDLIAVAVWTEGGVQVVPGDGERVQLGGATGYGTMMTFTLVRS